MAYTQTTNNSGHVNGSNSQKDAKKEKKRQEWAVRVSTYTPDHVVVASGHVDMTEEESVWYHQMCVQAAIAECEAQYAQGSDSA